MKTYYVRACSTRFVYKEVQANSIDEAEKIAYNVPLNEWDQDYVSGVYEHVGTVEKLEENLQ